MVRLNVEVRSTADVDGLTVGEVAARFGLHSHVLRHWESMGLLFPQRSVSGNRRYAPSDLYRVAVILRAKEAGLSLTEIGGLLGEDGAGRAEILRARRDELVRQITAAQSSLELIDCALECDHDDIGECPRFRDRIGSRMRATGADRLQ